MSALLALLSAFSWGSSDFLAGEQARRVGTVVVTWWIQVSGIVSLGAIWLVLYQADVVHFSTKPFLIGAAAGLAGIVGLSAFYRALATGPMSLVAPITAMSVVLPATWGLISGEVPSHLRLGAMAVVVLGILLVSKPPAVRHTHAVRVTPMVVLLAMFAALWFGVFQTMLDIAGDDQIAAATTAVLGVRAGGFIFISAICLVLAVAPWRLVEAGARVTGGGGASIRVLVAAGILDAGANTSYAIAAATGNFAIVAVLGALYPALTVLLAGIVLHERMVLHQFVGIGVALGGVAVLAATG